MVTAFLVIAASIAAIAAITDTRTGHIPNWLTLGALACAPIAHVIAALAGHASVLDALARGGVSLLGTSCAVVPLLLFYKGTLGGGDVKLFGAIGALCGFEIGLDIVLHSFILTAVLGIGVVVYRGTLLTLLRNTGTLIANAFRRANQKQPIAAASMTWMRMGPAILGATALQLVLRWRA